MRLSILGLLLSILLLPSPAHAEEPPRVRFADTAVCVQTVDSLQGWRVRRAIAIWNAVGVATLTRKQTCDPTAPRVLMHRANKDNGWAGWNLKRGRVVWDGVAWEYHRSDVTLNQHYFHRSCFNLWVTVHELGHALGLPHNHNARSPMGKGYDWAHRCGALSQRDVTNLRRLYR